MFIFKLPLSFRLPAILPSKPEPKALIGTLFIGFLIKKGLKSIRIFKLHSPNIKVIFMKTIKEKHLFMLDLDGTVLASSSTGEIHPLTKQGIQRAVSEGHVVAIITGRPWIGSKQIYEELGLDTIIANLNGAHIHNPRDEFFIDYIKYINLNEVLYILGDPQVEPKIKNLAIEGPGWVHLRERDPKLEEVFSFMNFPKIHFGINLTKIPLKPTGIIVDLHDDSDAPALLRYLRQRYSDLAAFSYWSKGLNESLVFDITAIGVDKGKVLSLLTRYYKIDVTNTVAIGDSFNDEEMLKLAHHPVAMLNSEPRIKRHAKYITKLDNVHGGVGQFILDFLDGKTKS